MRRRSLTPSKPQSSEQKPTLEGVLDHYLVDYKPRSSQMCRCPLHEDNTPSCSVNTDKQVWNCKSCGEGGDSLTMIMKMEDMDFERARGFATTQRIATGDAGGGGGSVRAGRYARGGAVSARPGSGRRDGGYVPSWRRG